MSASRKQLGRLIAAVVFFVCALFSVVHAESGVGLAQAPVSADRQAAAERQPSSITGVLMQARGGPASSGGFLDVVSGVQKGGSNCCTEGGNGGVGCDDATCESLICGADSFCCDTAWDGICADAAQASCAVCLGEPPPPESDCCTPGGNGGVGCDDPTCEAAVCGDDSFCCDTAWDGLCATSALELCPELCKGGGPEPEPEIDILVNTNADGIPADDGFCTLREAVMTANGVFFGFKTEGECQTLIDKGAPPGTLIGFIPELAGATISLNITDVHEDPPDAKGSDPTISDLFGPTALWVTSSIIIAGDPLDGIIIERDLAGPEMRLFLIASAFLCENKGEPCLPCVGKGGSPCPDPKGGDDKGVSLGIQFANVTLRNGIARGGDGGSGGFDEYMDSKGVPNGGNVSEATLEGGGGGGAGGFGGAVLNLYGYLSFENSTLNNNQAIGGNGGIAGAAAPGKGGSDLDATGGGGGGIGGDGFDGGNIGSESGDGGGLDGGMSPGNDGFFGGGGAGASDSFSGGDGGGFGGGGGGGSVAVSIFAKGDFSVNGRNAGQNFFIGGGGGGGARAVITTTAKGDSEGLPGFGGFGAGDGSFESGGGGAGMGGAVFNFGGSAISINSTFSGNSAIGGTGVDDPPDPKGMLESAQGEGLGGGIINVSGFLFMNNTTLSGNRADDGGGAVFHLDAGEVDPDCVAKGDCECGAVTGIFDSILANSLNLATDFDGGFVGAPCEFKGLETAITIRNTLLETGDESSKGTDNIIGEDPLLGPLADNTGPNHTHLPQPGSPVIDAVVPFGGKTRGGSPLRARTKGFEPVECEDRDQRGVPRNQLAECDMGSVEVLPGYITICKTEDPAPLPPKTLAWNFDGDLGFFGLNHGECTEPFEEAPDTYTVVEASNEPIFYLGAINCQSDGTLDVSVDLPNYDVDITIAEDENVTCTFVNEQAGNITIVKATDVPTAELFDFNHDIPIPPPPKEGEKGPGPDFTLPSGGAIGIPFIRPGTYQVSEVDPFPENFELDSIVCNDGNSSGSGLTATINLEPGENVECTFNNAELEAQLSLDKAVDGVPTDAFVGDQYTYTLILTNNGPGFATNVVVTDPLSPLIAFISSACATENPPGTVRWEVGTILAGQTLFCSFTVEILDVGIIENVAFADGDQGDTGGENEGGVMVKGATPVIPTLGPWALGLLALVLGTGGIAALRRR